MGCAGTPSPRRPAPSHRSPLNAIKTQNPQTQNSTVPTGGGLRAPDPTSSRTPGSRNLTPDLIGFSKEWEVFKVGCDGSFLGFGDLELLSGSPPHLHRAFRAPWYAGHSCQGPESSRDPEARPLAGPFLGRPTQLAGDGYLPVRLATAPRSSFSSSLPTRLPRPSDHPSGAGIRQITSPVDLRGGGTRPGTPPAGQPWTHPVSTPPQRHGPQPSATPSSEVSQAFPSAQRCLPLLARNCRCWPAGPATRLPGAATAQPEWGHERAGRQPEDHQPPSGGLGRGLVGESGQLGQGRYTDQRPPRSSTATSPDLPRPRPGAEVS